MNAINSVQLSNHGAYPVVKGQRLNGEDLIELADGLDANGMLRHDHLLTGDNTILLQPDYGILLEGRSDT